MHTWYKILTYLFYPFAPIYLFIRKLKKKVLEGKNIKPLFNNNLYTKNLEKAYEKIYKRKIDNLEPDHIYI